MKKEELTLDLEYVSIQLLVLLWMRLLATIAIHFCFCPTHYQNKSVCRPRTPHYNRLLFGYVLLFVPLGGQMVFLTLTPII
jgi:hypothetical protein